MKKLPYGKLIKYNKLYREQKRYNMGLNIFYRDKVVDNRERFGDWEMDCVEGKRHLSNKVIFNLTERRTRASLFYILNNHSGKEILNVFDKLEDIFKNDFRKVFKTITTDNGHEFLSVEQIEKSKFSDDKRTNIFYCDAYKPYQKGTVENQNRLLRRFIKKGSNFDQMTQTDINKIQNWINNYNRKILDGKSSYTALKKEFKSNNIDPKYLKIFI